jgi:hypothetical protein
VADVTIGGDASGAIAACAAAQGAIDSLHGKTVNVDINVREHDSGGGGLGGAARSMSNLGNAADRASRSTQGLGGHLDRAGRSAQGLGDHVGRAGDHMGRMADEAGRTRDHLEAVNRIMGGGAPSSIGRSSDGMRSLAGDAARARGAITAIGSGSGGMRAIESGASSAGRAMREIGAGAAASHDEVSRLGAAMGRASTFSVASSGRIGSDAGAASRLGSGDQTGRQSSNFAVDSGGNVSSRLSGASKEMERFTGSAAGMGSAMGGSGKEMERFGGRAGEMERHAGSLGRTIDAVGRTIDGAGGGSGGGGLGGLINKLGALPDAAIPSMGALKGVGLAAGVSALGMGALGAAVAGVGLAGVAEDFAHNSQLMHAGGEAVRGFNREFSAMRGATSAAGGAGMASLTSSMKGVGHELAGIGAANIGSVLGGVASLGNQATAAMTKLAPSIGPAIQAATALGGAILGAFGDSGPAVTSFANSITQNAAGLQALTSSAINTAGAVGNATVDALGGAGQFDSGVGSPSGKPPGSAIDTNGSHSLGGMLQSLAMLAMGGPLVAPFGAAGAASELISGPSGGGGAPVAAGQFDPSKPFSGQLPDGKGGFTTGTGDGGAAKPSKASGGGYQPSPDAARFSGMSAGDIMTQQRADVGMPPVGAPHYSGVGPRGPGQSVGAMPSSISAGLGGGGLAPLDNMMSAAQSHIASSGGGGGGGMAAAAVKHVQKATDVASGAASAGGASVGAALGSGMAAGTSSSLTVTDNIVRRHIKHIIDIASAGLGIASPSKEFDYLGRMTGQGFGQGIERSSDHTFGAMDGMLTGAQDQARKTSLDYDGGNDGAGMTVTAPRKPDPNQDPNYRANAMQYSPTAMDNIKTHNDRAARLAQGRADNHAIAMANLGITNPETGQKWVDPRRMNSNPLAGTAADPAAKAGGNNPLSGVKGLSDRFQQGGGLKGALGLEGMFHQAGHDSVQGLTAGMTAHVSKVQAAGGNLAGAGHAGYKKKDKQSSPSAEWAGIGGNSVAGLGVGFTAGVPGVVSAMSSAAGTMSDVVGGYLSDRGLMAGYAWAQNMVTGVNTEIKKADYQAMGIPKLAAEATRGLAATGLLTAGSGAQSYKTPGNAPGMVTLAPASSSSGGDQTITINHNIVHDDGHISQVATVVTLDMFGKLKDAQATRPR